MVMWSKVVEQDHRADGASQGAESWNMTMEQVEHSLGHVEQSRGARPQSRWSITWSRVVKHDNRAGGA